MATFVPFDGGADPKIAIAPPPAAAAAASSSRSPTKSKSKSQDKVGKNNNKKGRSTSVGTWEEGQSQLTDDHSYDHHDDVYSSGGSSYYTTDESGDLSGDLDDLKRTFTEALQLIGVGTPVRESSSAKKKSSRSSSSRRTRGELSDRHGGGRSRRRRRHGNKKGRADPNNKERSRRGPVAASPVRSTPSRPRRRTPSASIMKKPGRASADVAAAGSGGPPPPPPPPQVPTLVEWSEAYGIDRELQVVKILVQNDRAKEAYVWQLNQQQGQNSKNQKKKSNKVEDGSTNTNHVDKTDGNGGANDTSNEETTLRLSLHEELVTDKLRYDPRDGMLYFIENVPQSPSDARLLSSASASAYAANANTNSKAKANTTKGGSSSMINQSNKTNRLRIVPQTLRRRLFNVALHQTGTANASTTLAAATTTTAFSVFHRLRSSYYWAGMYHDVHRWWNDCERMVLAAEAGEMAAVARSSAPGTPTKVNNGTNGSANVVESPYRVSNELRVTFSQDHMDDVDTTVDTCLDMTMDTDDGVMLMGLGGADGANNTPPSSPGAKLITLAERFKTPSPMRKKADKPDPPGSTASLSSTLSASKTKKILQKAVTSLTPTRVSPSRKAKSVPKEEKDEELATVEYTQVVPSDGPIVSAPPAAGSGTGMANKPTSGRAGTPTSANLSDAPTLVRRTSFVSLLRSKSRDVDDDAASQHTAENLNLQQASRRGSSVPPPLSPRASSIRAAAGLPPTSPPSSSSALKKSESVESFGKRSKSRDVDDDAVSQHTAENLNLQQASRRGSSVPPPLSPRASSIRAAAGLPPTSPPSSSSALKKSESVESFGKRFKGIGKKIAGNRKEDKVCTVTPVVRTGPSPRLANSVATTNAEPRASAAGVDHYSEEQRQEKVEGAAARSDGAVSFFFDVESVSKQFVTFLDTFADSMCKDGNSDDESQVWQRAVPSVIGLDNSKNA